MLIKWHKAMQRVEKIPRKNRVEHEQRVAAHFIGDYHCDCHIRSNCVFKSVPIPEEKVGEGDRPSKESAQEAEINAVEVGNN